MFYWFGSETMKKNTIQESSRRNFLRTATVAAAAGLTLGDSKLFAAPALGQGTAAAPDSFKLYTAEHLAEEWQALEKAPANKTIVMTPNYSIILTVEKAKSAKEFEWHEGRDHIVQIIDGSTLYEVGGTPTGTKVMPGTGEWHATGSTGSKSILMVKGDMLLIPRGTLHKRSTEDSVTFLLISNPVPAKV